MKRRRKILTYTLIGALSLGLVGSPTVLANGANVQKEPRSSEKHKKVDPETQKKVDNILNTLKSDLSGLGISPHNERSDVFANLDDKTKGKAKEIIRKVKDGTITKEDADKQLKALGVELRKHHDSDALFANLDDKTKAKAKEIIRQVKEGTLTKVEADKQLKALGVELPWHHAKGERFDNLDDETKAKAKALIEEAKAQLEELGAELPSKYMHLIK